MQGDIDRFRFAQQAVKLAREAYLQKPRHELKLIGIGFIGLRV